VEGVIVGMGFIGGGAILKHSGKVTGTATAASLWATGAMGLSVGVGSYDVAITICVVTFLTLKLLPVFKDEKGGRRRCVARTMCVRTAIFMHVQVVALCCICIDH